jgi:hypothetical protein
MMASTELFDDPNPSLFLVERLLVISIPFSFERKLEMRAHRGTFLPLFLLAEDQKDSESPTSSSTNRALRLGPQI